MSRSTRKPYWTDQQTNKTGRVKLSKRKANRAVRSAMKSAIKNEADHLADGKQYRKASNPYDIRDWSFHDPKSPKVRRK